MPLFNLQPTLSNLPAGTPLKFAGHAQNRVPGRGIILVKDDIGMDKVKIKFTSWFGFVEYRTVPSHWMMVDSTSALTDQGSAAIGAPATGGTNPIDPAPIP